MTLLPETPPPRPTESAINLSHPLLQKIASGAAEERIRQAGAKGALPLDRANVARLFYLLSRDPDKAIRLTLKQTIDGYHEDILAGIASDVLLETPVLHFLAAACPGRVRVLEEVTLNPHTSTETLQFLAKRADGDMLELLSINEQRLIQSPALVATMLENAGLTPRVRLLLREIQVRHFGVKTDDKDLAHLKRQAEAQEEEEARAAFAATPLPEAKQVVAEIKGQLKSEAASGETEEEELNLYMRIKGMNTGQKIRACSREGRQGRMLLVRDSNKAVQRAVITCPKITTSELEIIAQLRNVSEETLEHIGKLKACVKNLAIAQALVRNPRTPQHIAIQLMPNFPLRDLDIIQRDRNVGEAVRRQARFLAIRKINPQGEKKFKPKKK